MPRPPIVRAATEKNIPLEIEFEGPIPGYIDTDPVRLRQILLNLIGNAIKFTDDGDVRVICRYDSLKSRLIFHLAQHFIEKAGGNVITATNGREAIDTLYSDSTPPMDLIVMDMQMPVMDGCDATAELRRRGCHLPIIALTANAMKSDRRECLDAGCTDYATKPLDRNALIAMIHRLTSRDRSATPHDQSDHEEDQEHDEQDFSDRGRGTGDNAETQNTSNQRDD